MSEPATEITWVVTTESAPWQLRRGPDLAPLRGMPDVFVHLDRPQQTIEGFGACFNELGWTSLGALTEAHRQEILRELFSPGAGANLTLCRMPLGANDFSRDWYSYDEVPGDFALTHFDIAQDHETLIPFIRAAKEHQPDLRLWASPWSPPTWMKTNGHYAGAMPIPGFQDVENGLTPEQVGREGTDMFIQEEAFFAAYAAYFGRFIDAYCEQGIGIGMVMPQNEFNSPQVFPSCTWTTEGLARFLPHLGPEMRRRGVEVFIGTLERPDDHLVRPLLEDRARVRRRPERLAPLPLRVDPAATLPFQRGHGVHVPEHLPPPGRDQPLGVGAELPRHGGVDAAAGTYEFTHEYHLLKHVTHYVQPGARVLPTLSASGFENQLVFRNPDGSLVVVIQNDTGIEQPVTILLEGRTISPVLPADSFSTFVVPAEA